MNLQTFLERMEGRKSTIYYVDGVPHIGIGHNINEPISERSIDEIYLDDVKRVYDDLSHVFSRGWYWAIGINRENALVSIMFTLGLPRFMGFEKMIDPIKAHDWPLAAKELLDSDRGRELPERSAVEAYMLEHNAMPEGWEE